jgi:hypothetical protein
MPGGSTSSDSDVINEFVNSTLQKNETSAYMKKAMPEISASLMALTRFVIDTNVVIDLTMTSFLEMAEGGMVNLPNRESQIKTLLTSLDNPRVLRHIAAHDGERVVFLPTLMFDMEKKCLILQRLSAGEPYKISDLIAAGIDPYDIISCGVTLDGLIYKNKLSIEELSELGFRFRGLITLGFSLEHLKQYGYFTIRRIVEAFPDDNVNVGTMMELSNSGDQGEKLQDFLNAVQLTTDDLVILNFKFPLLHRILILQNLLRLSEISTLQDMIGRLGLTAGLLIDYGIFSKAFFVGMRWINHYTVDNICRLFGVDTSKIQTDGAYIKGVVPYQKQNLNIQTAGTTIDNNAAIRGVRSTGTQIGPPGERYITNGNPSPQISSKSGSSGSVSNTSQTRLNPRLTPMGNVLPPTPLEGKLASFSLNGPSLSNQEGRHDGNHTPLYQTPQNRGYPIHDGYHSATETDGDLMNGFHSDRAIHSQHGMSNHPSPARSSFNVPQRTGAPNMAGQNSGSYNQRGSDGRTVGHNDARGGYGANQWPPTADAWV